MVSPTEGETPDIHEYLRKWSLMIKEYKETGT